MRPRAALRPSLRVKLTLAFAAAMALLLTGLGLFIYARFETSLDQSLNQGLRSRSEDVRALVNQADTGLADAGGARLSRTGTGLAQVLTPRGSVLDQTPGIPRMSILGARSLALALQRPVLTTTRIRGVAGPVRVLATPVRAQDRPLLVIVAASLESRAAALKDLRDSEGRSPSPWHRCSDTARRRCRCAASSECGARRNGFRWPSPAGV